MNWILQVYDPLTDAPMATIEFFASTSITADKIALNIVEREYVGMDWSLTLKE